MWLCTLESNPLNSNMHLHPHMNHIKPSTIVMCIAPSNQSSEVLYNCNVYFPPSNHLNQVLFNFIVHLHPQTTQNNPYSTQMCLWTLKTTKSKPSSTQMRPFRTQICLYTPNTLKSYSLQLKCAFAPSIYSNDLHYIQICTIIFNNLKLGPSRFKWP